MRAATLETGLAPPRFQLVYSDPTFGEVERHAGTPPAQSTVTAALVEAIGRAQTRITVSSNYLNGDEELIRAFEDAAKRGVLVEIVTSGPEASGGMAALIHAGSEGFFYERLFRAGVHIYETVRQEHGKMLVIDDTLGGWGSYNLELCSDGALVEAYLFTTSADVVRDLQESLQDTIDHRSREWSPQPPNLWEAFVSLIMKMLGWLIRPLL